MTVLPVTVVAGEVLPVTVVSMTDVANDGVAGDRCYQ